MNTLVEKVKEFNAYMKANGEAGIKDLFAKFFEAVPEVYAVRWTQYAPYFNDGAPCIFSVYEPEIALAKPGSEIDPDDGSEVDVFESVYYHSPKSEHSEQLRASFKELKDSFPLLSDVFEMTFGSDQQVTIFRDGTIKNEEYDHD
jgi:hypothetical protein